MNFRAYGLLGVMSLLTFLTTPALATSVSVTINEPSPTSDVTGGGCFFAAGYSSPSGCTHQAWITHGSNTYYGISITPPYNNPPYQWAFWFQDIPMDVWVTLTAKATYNGSVATESIQIRCVE